MADVFNCDITGLNFKNFQSTTLALRSEHTSGKLSKEKLSVLFCCSSRKEKLPLLIIGKAKKPRCFTASNTIQFNHKAVYKSSKKKHG